MYLLIFTETKEKQLETMSELLSISHDGTFNEEETSVIVGAEFSDFNFKALIDSDIRLDGAADFDLGISNSYRQDGIDFFNVEILDEMSQPINLGKEEMAKVKQEIENYFDGLVQEL